VSLGHSKRDEAKGDSDESEIASVYAAGEEDVDIAVKAARKALKDPSWKSLPGTDRGRLMLKLADLVEEHKETLATIETWDNGIFPPFPFLPSLLFNV